jgi:small GTP-binding protein
VVILGDTNTGKTSLVLRFVEGHYRAEARSATVGAFFLTKRLTVNHTTCKMLLWDTAGQQQFQKLAVTYYRNAAAAVLAFDVCQPGSVVQMKRWLEQVLQNTAGRRIVIAVAACKGDLEAAPGLEEEAQRLAVAADAIYVKTSAKDNTGVHELFEKVAARVLQWHREEVAGTGLHIPVTVGVGQLPHSTRVRSSAHHLSPYRTTARAESPSEKGEHHNNDASSGHTPDTVAEDDVMVEGEEKKQEDISSNPMCEGSLLVCGTDDRGCCLM